jgi:hypothetical protein
MAVVESRLGTSRLRGSRGGHRIGAILDELRRESFHVLHDVELTEDGTVDYLVLGGLPTGLALRAVG